jgi:hypothetical protein
LFNEVAGQGNAFGQGFLRCWFCQVHSARARVTTSRTSLLRSGLAATRAMASRAALR